MVQDMTSGNLRHLSPKPWGTNVQDEGGEEMTEIKIHMGTPKGRESLCRFCSRSQVIRGVDNQERAYCHFGTTREIQFPVYTCSVFEDNRLPSLDEMKKIAWRVETRNRGRWGFSSGDEREITVEPPYQSPENYPGEQPSITRGT